MMQLKDDAFERSSGNQTSFIGLNAVTSRTSNIIAAWVPIPTTPSAKFLHAIRSPIPIRTVMQKFLVLACQVNRTRLERVRPRARQRTTHTRQQLGGNAGIFLSIPDHVHVPNLWQP